MLEESKTREVEMQPVTALVIGSSGTGDGGTVQRQIVTPDGQPNIVIKVISPMLAIIIRFIDTFLTVLVSLVGAGTTTNLIPAADFYELVWKCSQLALTGALLGLLKDLVTLFTSLKAKWPLLNA